LSGTVRGCNTGFGLEFIEKSGQSRPDYTGRPPISDSFPCPADNVQWADNRIPHHQIDAEEGRIKLTDRVYYEVPYGIFGKIIHFFFIRKTLKRIFNYRKEKLAELLTMDS
jgi:hypothetical protein